jgi:hypothetical protein
MIVLSFIYGSDHFSVKIIPIIVSIIILIKLSGRLKVIKQINNIINLYTKKDSDFYDSFISLDHVSELIELDSSLPTRTKIEDIPTELPYSPLIAPYQLIPYRLKIKVLITDQYNKLINDIPKWRGKFWIYLIKNGSIPVDAFRKIINYFNPSIDFNYLVSNNFTQEDIQNHAKLLYNFAFPNQSKILSPVYGKITSEAENMFVNSHEIKFFNSLFDSLVTRYLYIFQNDILLRWLFISDKPGDLADIKFIYEAMWHYAYHFPNDPKRFNQASDLFSRAFCHRFSPSPGEFDTIPPLDYLLAKVKYFAKSGASLDGPSNDDLKKWTDFSFALKDVEGLSSLASGLCWLGQTNLERSLLYKMVTEGLPLTAEIKERANILLYSLSGY